MHSCQNMVKTLQAAVDDGWQVLGAMMDQTAMSSRDVRVARPTILVMGEYVLEEACDGVPKV